MDSIHLNGTFQRKTHAQWLTDLFPQGVFYAWGLGYQSLMSLPSPILSKTWKGIT